MIGIRQSTYDRGKDLSIRRWDRRRDAGTRGSTSPVRCKRIPVASTLCTGSNPSDTSRNKISGQPPVGTFKPISISKSIQFFEMFLGILECLDLKLKDDRITFKQVM